MLVLTNYSKISAAKLLLLFSFVLGFPLYEFTDIGRAATHQLAIEVWCAPRAPALKKSWPLATTIQYQRYRFIGIGEVWRMVLGETKQGDSHLVPKSQWDLWPSQLSIRLERIQVKLWRSPTATPVHIFKL